VVSIFGSQIGFRARAPSNAQACDRLFLSPRVQTLGVAAGTSRLANRFRTTEAQLGHEALVVQATANMISGNYATGATLRRARMGLEVKGAW